MGYYAQGDGLIKLRASLPDDFKMPDIFDEFDIDENSLYVSYSGKYYEDEIYDFCEKIKNYTESGTINFSGEDGCIWRFIFRGKEWTEESARILYESDPALTLSDVEKADLVGQLIDVIEDVLSDGKPSEIIAEGSTYDQLSRRLTDTLVNWHIL